MKPILAAPAPLIALLTLAAPIAPAASGPAPRGFTPPARVINVRPDMSLGAINASLARAGSGNTVAFAAGTYPAGAIKVPEGVYAYSPNACAAVLSGNVILSSNATLDGFRVNNGLVDLRQTKNASVGRNCFEGGAAADTVEPTSPSDIIIVVWVNDARNFLVIDNSFNNFPGGVYGWSTTGRIAGNRFLNGRQAIGLNFTTAEIDHNYASGLTRMFVELGANEDPDTSNGVKVHDNYEESPNPIPDPGSTDKLTDAVSFSVVPKKGGNNAIFNNFVAASPNTCGIAIELANSGTVSGNYAIGCRYGIAVYGKEPQTVTNNDMVDASAPLAGNDNPNLHQSRNVTDARRPIPAKPSTVIWH